MGEPTGGLNPIDFDFGAADELASEFRRTASKLRAQAAGRGTAAETALEEWRGLYSRHFRRRVDASSRDAIECARVMEVTARNIETFADAVKDENDRRARARAIMEDERTEGTREKVWEAVTFRSDGISLPPPVEPPKFETPSVPVRGRS